MKPYRICALAVIFILCLGFIQHINRPATRTPQHTTDIQSDFRGIFPDAQNFRRAKTEIPIYEALGTNQKILGYAFRTEDFAPDVKGHGGAIKMVAAIDRSGTILNIKILTHQETPAYVAMMPDFLKRLIGHPTTEPLQLGKNIDGISGATITSNAIITAINRSGQKIHSTLNLKTQPQSIPLPDFKRPLIGITLFLLAIFAWTYRNKTLHWIALAASFIILGIIFKEMLSVSYVSGMVLGQIPDWHQNPLLYILIAGALLSCLLFGRIFCSGVCPFAFVQEGLHWIKRKLFKTIHSPNKKTDAACRRIKYIILIIILATCVMMKNSGIGATEIYITLFTLKGSALAKALLTVVLIASFFFLRFWCRYLCPFGAFLGLCSQFPLLKKYAAPHASGRPCAEPSECFDCERCVQGNFTKSTTTQDTAFRLILALCVVLFAATFTQSFSAQRDFRNPPQEKTLAATQSETYIDVEKVRKRIDEAGLTPRPAKYWRTIGND